MDDTKRIAKLSSGAILWRWQKRKRNQWTDLNASRNRRIQILPEEETLIFKLPKQDENRLNANLEKSHTVSLRRI